MVGTIFDKPDPTFVESWLGAIAYTVQLYFDFSGYSEMAIGLGLMIGFRLIRNFDTPYISRSITEFWRRWHISLSTWLRDYLYISLGGSRAGSSRWFTYRNLMLTMLLGGLWHGAAWTFIVWGAIHGTVLAIERVLTNLLENAVEYTPPESPIEITAGAADGELTVEVADHGAGLPPGTERRVFEKFFRVHSADSRHGVGLGLAIARGIVESTACETADEAQSLVGNRGGQLHASSLAPLGVDDRRLRERRQRKLRAIEQV